MHDNPIVILGAFETALGVARSIGISLNKKVFVLDFKKDIAFYSRYAIPILIPDPYLQEELFLKHLIKLAKEQRYTPVLFITSDNYFPCVINNYELLSEYFLFNLPSREILNSIKDKYLLFQLALKNNISVPVTYKIFSLDDLSDLKAKRLTYPLIIKGLEAYNWRKIVSNSIKVFVVNNESELEKKVNEILKKNIPLIVQEIIQGPDSNHFKVCVYYDKRGIQILNFTLRKIRQNPIHFGVGSVVESIYYPELSELGSKLFDQIGYRGVGSAEFKLDLKDNQLKLIEINPRYWQQNYLATACGMNFPLTDYLENIGSPQNFNNQFRTNVKWINIYMDFESFLDYKKEGELNFFKWTKSLKGKKVFSDFVLYDPLPLLFELFHLFKLKKIYNILLFNSNRKK